MLKAISRSALCERRDTEGRTVPYDNLFEYAVDMTIIIGAAPRCMRRTEPAIGSVQPARSTGAMREGCRLTCHAPTIATADDTGHCACGLTAAELQSSRCMGGVSQLQASERELLPSLAVCTATVYGSIFHKATMS